MSVLKIVLHGGTGLIGSKVVAKLSHLVALSDNALAPAR